MAMELKIGTWRFLCKGLQHVEKLRKKDLKGIAKRKTRWSEISKVVSWSSRWVKKDLLDKRNASLQAKNAINTSKTRYTKKLIFQTKMCHSSPSLLSASPGLLLTHVANSDCGPSAQWALGPFGHMLNQILAIFGVIYWLHVESLWGHVRVSMVFFQTVSCQFSAGFDIKMSCGIWYQPSTGI